MRHKKKILFTSDISGLLLGNFPLVVVPKNRLTRWKVRVIIKQCEKKGIPVDIHNPENETLCTEEGLDSYSYIRRFEPDIGVSWFYTQLFPQEMLNVFPRGILNFHAGPAGAHALQRAIKAGNKEIRCFWHWVDEGVDTGPVVAETVIPLPGIFDVARIAIICAGVKLFEEI